MQVLYSFTFDGMGISLNARDLIQELKTQLKKIQETYEVHDPQGDKLWEYVAQIVDQLSHIIPAEDPQSQTKRSLGAKLAINTKRLRKLMPPTKKMPTIPQAPQAQWLSPSEVQELLGVSADTLESLLAGHHIRPMTINAEKMYSANEILLLQNKLRQDAVESELPGQESQTEPQLNEELKYDQELVEFLATSAVPLHFIPRGTFFLSNTKNGNYNALNIFIIISQRLSSKNVQAVLEEVYSLLHQRDQLFAYTQELVERELNSPYFFNLCQNEETCEQLTIALLMRNLLARYYADFALMKLAAKTSKGSSLPEQLSSFAPLHISELAAAILWPPSERDAQKREALVGYGEKEKILYMLIRLGENNPIEFDLNKL